MTDIVTEIDQHLEQMAVEAQRRIDESNKLAEMYSVANQKSLLQAFISELERHQIGLPMGPATILKALVIRVAKDG